MKNPCKDCMKRHEGCHGSCDAYISWRAWLDEINLRRRRENKVNDDYARMRLETFKKIRRGIK